jgi:hypothetical protein
MDQRVADAFASPLRRRLAALLLAAVVGALVSTVLADAAQAGTVGVTARIQGAGSIVSVEGGPYSCSFTSQQDDRVTSTCPRQTFGAVFEASVTLRATPASFPAGHWRFVGWTGCQELQVDGDCVVRSGAFSLDERFPTARFDDVEAPTVSAISESFSTTVERRVAFGFATNEGQTQCRIDGEVPFTSCSSGIARTFSSEGPHTIDVRAVDPSGQIGATSSRTITVVDTALVDSPAPLAASRTATFSYASDAGTEYLCSLDFAPFAPCGPGTTKTYTGLADGPHTFRVFARNGSWFDRIPASRSWRVDATAPDTTITSGPDAGGRSTLTTAQLGFGASEPGATFECRLDGGAFAPCTSPRSLSGLAVGDHTFEVRARDTAGNADPSPASRSWTVVAPDAGGTATAGGADAPAPTGGGGSVAPAPTSSGGSGAAGATSPAVAGPVGPVATPPRARMRITLVPQWRSMGRTTILRRLVARGVPAGATIVARCSSARCAKRRLVKRAASSSVDLTALVRSRRLPAGTRITVTVTRAGSAAAVVTLKTRSGKRPLVA